MRKTLKGLCILLTITMILVLYSGCSGSTANTSTSSDNTGKTTTETSTSDSVPSEKKGEKMKISMVTDLLCPPDENGIMKRYWEEKFNVELDLWYIDGNFDEVMNLKFAANEIPDVINVRSFSSFYRYIDQEIITEIPEELAYKNLANYITLIEKELPGIMKYGYVDGKLYGIPNQIRSHNQFRAPVVWRGDWLSKLGYNTYPETLEEFEEVFYKMAHNDPDGNGVKDTYGLSSSGLDGIYGAFGVSTNKWLEYDGKLGYSAVQPAMKDALALLNKWYKDEVLDPEFITGENKGGYWAISHAFIEGRIGYTSHGSYYHWCKPEDFPAAQNYIEFKLINPEAADQMVFGVPPKGPDGKQGITQSPMFTSTFMAFGSHMANDLAKMERIMQMQDYFCTDVDTYLTAYYGKQGEFWEYDKAGIPQPLGVYTDPKEMAKQGAHYAIVMLSPRSYHDVINKGGVEWARKNNFHIGGVINKLLVPLPDEATYMTELNKMRDETIVEIITGDKPLDYFDEFVKKWYDAGGEILTKQANEWYETIK